MSQPFIFHAKLQQIGKQSGRPRYMIYVTKAADKMDLTRGDILEVFVRKIRHEVTCPNRSIEGIKRAHKKREELIKGIKNTDGINEIPLGEKNKESEKTPKEVILNEEEQYLKERYLNAPNENIKEFIKKRAIKKYGKERIKVILDVQES